MQLIRVQEIDIFKINLFIINGGRVCVHAVIADNPHKSSFFEGQGFLSNSYPFASCN